MTGSLEKAAYMYLVKVEVSDFGEFLVLLVVYGHGHVARTQLVELAEQGKVGQVYSIELTHFDVGPW